MVEYHLYMHIRKWFTFFVMVWVAAGFAFPAITWAGPFQPGETIRITTATFPENTSFSGEVSPKESPLLEWSVVPQTSASGDTTLAFIMTDSGQVICRLVVSDSGSKKEANLSWDESARPPKIIQQAGLLIAPGSPVPCDMLPLDFLTGNVASITYEVKRFAGGQTFVESFQVDGVETDVTEARTNGWLTGRSLPNRLIMITAVNVRTGALVVRQLWAPGDDWWLFEETPYRQSWRIRE